MGVDQFSLTEVLINIDHFRQRHSDVLLPATETPTTQLPMWIWVVQAFLGYEWLTCMLWRDAPPSRYR